MSNRDSNSRVFLGRLPPHTRERDIERFFRGFGRIREINLKTGFAFVEFDERRDADDAVYELNHKEMLGERITVEHAHPSDRSYGGGSGGGGGRGYGGGGGGNRRGSRFRDNSSFSRYGPPYNTEYRMVVENLSTRASWQDLKDYMRQAGEVTFAKCHKERVGEGVVEFASYDDMKRAIKRLDGTDLLGKRIRLVEGKSRRSRSRSPRRRSSSRRSRSRSRSPKNRHSRSPQRSASKSPQRSRSGSPADRRSKSAERGKSPAPDGGNSPARSRSASPAREQEKV